MDGNDFSANLKCIPGSASQKPRTFRTPKPKILCFLGDFLFANSCGFPGFSFWPFAHSLKNIKKGLTFASEASYVIVRTLFFN